MGLLTKLLILALAIPIFMVFDQQIQTGKFYVFDQHKLHEIAKKGIAKNMPTKDLVHYIVTELDKAYPGHVDLTERWIFNNAGGAMGQFLLIHASFTEYVIIFGSPIGTIGHSGRYFADDYFMILEGEQWVFTEGDLNKTVYRPGELNHLPRGKALGYRIPERTWALEYARGWIPLMFPFGVVEVFTSTMDFVSLYGTLDVYAKNVIREITQGKI